MISTQFPTILHDRSSRFVRYKVLDFCTLSLGPILSHHPIWSLSFVTARLTMWPQATHSFSCSRTVASGPSSLTPPLPQCGTRVCSVAHIFVAGHMRTSAHRSTRRPGIASSSNVLRCKPHTRDSGVPRCRAALCHTSHMAAEGASAHGLCRHRPGCSQRSATSATSMQRQVCRSRVHVRCCIHLACSHTTDITG